MDYPQARYAYPPPPTDGELVAKASHYFPDHDPDVLDSSILGADMMQHPHPPPMRKGSFVDNSAVISPSEPHSWPPQYPSGLPVDPASAMPHAYHDDHHAFVQQPGHHMPSFVPSSQPHQWPQFDPESGDCTPTNRMDFEQPPAAATFEAPQYISQRSDSARGSFSQNRPAHQHAFSATEESFIPAPQVQTPLSPHTHSDWMSLAAQEAEGRPHSRRLRGASPPQTTVDFQRRDGIRKKNARIEIPQERSIQTIEQMLETVQDEDVLKELKQQKRLLRNREAALASRQRKKKHTEDLELREKEFNRAMEELQTQIMNLQHDRKAQDNRHEIMLHRLHEVQRQLESSEEEKRDNAVKHNEETSALRRRIRVLTEQQEAEMAPAMSVVPSSTGFNDFNAEMEALSMGSQDWDNLIFSGDLQPDTLDELGFDTKPEQLMHPAQPDNYASAADVTPMPAKHAADGTPDQNVSQGLLFFLLLCGAFVASRPASIGASNLPHVPADVRAAAPKVLNTLLYEDRSSTGGQPRASALEAAEPSASGFPAAQSKTRSRLDRIHQRITAPTRQQEVDSAFSLTPAEYASITNVDYPPNHAAGPSQQHEHRHHQHDDEQPTLRRSLAETLASMQDESSTDTRTSKAEVYTRSLLWDQIPADVVKQFREMVRDHDELEARQQQQQQLAHEQQHQRNRQNLDHDEMIDRKPQI